MKAHLQDASGRLPTCLPGLMQSVLPAPVIPHAPNALAELAQASHDLLPLQTQPNASL